jgi:AraC-like DNA-binding protein
MKKMPHLPKHTYLAPTERSEPPQSSRQGLTASFKQYKLNKGETYQVGQITYNQFIFILEGNLIVNSSEALGQFVNGNEFFFLPSLANLSMEGLSSCHFVTLFFDRFVNHCERSYIRELCPVCEQKGYRFQTMDIRRPLLRFVRDMITYQGRLINNVDYYSIKYEELLYIFRMAYSKEEMAALFHPVVGKSLDFRIFILSNYLKAKNIHALAGMSGLKRKTFDRQFNEEFGETPYQWILKQKAKHICYELSETNDQMQDVMKKYGFAIPPHFTRFCRDYFECTPLELRRRLRQNKSRQQDG